MTKFSSPPPRTIIGTTGMPHVPEHSAASTAATTPAEPVTDGMQTTATSARASANFGAADSPERVGPFRITGTVGHGGMGVVLRAEDAEFGRTLAVKLLLARHQDDAELHRRFLDEARITGQLQHPGVPPVHAVGKHSDGRPYLAMKLVNGRTLSELMRSTVRGPSPGGEFAAEGVAGAEHSKAPDRGCADSAPATRSATDYGPRTTDFLVIFAQVCQTIAFAHSRGIIHRDLKPSNIMVGAFGEVQVMDWGLAKVRSSDGASEAAAAEKDIVYPPRPAGPEASTQAGSVIGTPAYMSPEQARGQNRLVDERSDVFGLGALLCTILTGKPAYVGATQEYVFRLAKAGNTSDAIDRLQKSGADGELVALASSCLRFKPEDRPRNAGEVAAALTAYQARAEERLRRAELERTAAQVQAREERKRRKLALALAAAVLGLVMIGGGAAWWLERQEGERRAERIQHAREQRQGIEAALAQFRPALRHAHWREARAILDQANRRLGLDGPEDLQQLLTQAGADLDLAVALDKIRHDAVAVVENHVDFAGAAKAYAQLFESIGYAVGTESPAVAAERVQRSSIQDHLVAALDDWAGILADEDRLIWVLAVARHADPDPAWKDRLRSPQVWADGPALRALAAESKIAELSPSLITVLARRVSVTKGDPTPLLANALLHHPRDFWLSFAMADALHAAKRDLEAEGFYRAALAVRPDSAAVYNNLGVTLNALGRAEDALVVLEKAIAVDAKFTLPRMNYGDALRQLYRFEEALEVFEAYRASVPDNPKAHNSYANALRDFGRLDEAIAAYEKAIALDQKYALAHANLGAALTDQGKFKLATAVSEKAIALDPKLPDGPNNLGNLLRAQGRLDEAVAEFDKALALDPRYARAHYNLGVVRGEQGKIDDAIAAYEKAIALDPRLALAHNNLGNMLLAKGRTNEAIASLEKSIALHARYAQAHYNLGVALHHAKRVDDAQRAYEKAVAIDPKYAAAYFNLGNILRSRGKVDDAIAAFEKAITFDPKDVRAHNNLANALRSKGRLNDAIAFYRKAVAIDPKYAKGHYNLGAALRAAGRFEAASAAFADAAALDPKNAEAHYNRAFALHKLCRWDEAATAYRKACALAPRDAECLNALGVVLREQGKVDEAIATHQKATAIDPRSAQAHSALGLAFLEDGRFHEAVKASRRARDLLPSGHPLEKVVAQQVRTCELMMEFEPRFSAMVTGAATPKDANECLQFAQWARFKRQFAHAVRFYREGFADKAALAESRNPAHRFHAACCAVLIAAGRDSATDSVSEQQRAALRRQALAWMQAEVTTRSNDLDKGGDREATLQALRYIKNDVALAPVRQADALAKLPQAEAAAWQQLWTDVDRLLAPTAK